MMGGLFGGSSAPVVQEVKQAATDANKGATDLEKLTQKKERKKAFGGSMGSTDNLLSGDTTLASGSLLSLGSKLG